ncbi:alpha/beta hydrolase [Corynebacterium testudinoris]|uniref:Lysophospholipase n=1 Tax=Corynebacterium testudinoris TaxID=136857 RepID=A0A0G3HBY9_9CORY|nr:alpha/beta hydrolase [Corynebacterium testudinoris]AKK09463.1 lysophospholipase [Corynebacterium testudinoris]MBX8997030.1 alpha/beta hydrolase [Corynebacterium testudinoris]
MMRAFRWVAIVTVTVLVVAVGAVGVGLAGNSYAFDERQVEIPLATGSLSGVLTMPKSGEAHGVVVMVHGDGPVDATQNGLYDPWFDGAAASGYATLSWSKPGVGGSDGDWLTQSLPDRAAEVSTAVDWAKAQPDVPTSTIVLWGASQAGWVLPVVVADRDDIDGVVAVGTAINWLRQGQFNLQSELDHDRADAEQRARAEAASATTDALLERGASYEEYLGETTEADPMTLERWGFVQGNFRADATSDLARAATRHIPWLLLAGEHDRNVDVHETAEVYLEIFGGDVKVTWVDAVHSMARPIVDDSEFIGLVTGVFWPRLLLADGVIDSYRGLLDQVADSH